MNETERLIGLTEKYGAHNYHPLDIVIAEAEGVWVEDVEGKRYMDMLSAYSALNQGHCHPKIARAVIRQIERGVTLTSRAFHNDQLGPFLEKLHRISGKDRALPMNSGAEAVETALKACRKWGEDVKGVAPGTAEIIVCEGNFHGRTITIVSFSTEEQYKRGFGPYTPGFKIIPYGDAEALEKAIAPNTVGFLVEPIQGEGGVRVPAKGYLSQCAKICRENNVLLMADEIQTGLGRTGKMFACDHENVVPDIYIIGKALSGGFGPVSAILADDEIMGVFTPGDHGSTFGGSPLASAVGMAALDVLIEEKLPENAAVMGEYFMSKLRGLNSPHVQEIRGKGLLIGVEIKPESGNARGFCERLKEEGILAKETHDTVVRFAPPLIITKAQIDWAMERIARVLAG